MTAAAEPAAVTGMVVEVQAIDEVGRELVVLPIIRENRQQVEAGQNDIVHVRLTWDTDPGRPFDEVVPFCIVPNQVIRLAGYFEREDLFLAYAISGGRRDKSDKTGVRTRLFKRMGFCQTP